MGFGGSTSGANTSLKNNRALRSSAKKNKLKWHQYKVTAKNAIQNSQEASQEELKQIRTRLSLQNKKRERKILAFTALIMILLISVFIYYVL